MKLAILLLIGVMASIIGESQSQQSMGTCPPNSNEGRDFYLAIPLLLYDGSSKKVTIYIASAHEGTAHVDYSADSLSRSYHISQGETSITLSPVVPGSNSSDHYGIHLTSDVDIAVTMFVYSQTVYMAQYLALPVTALSTNYTVPNAKPFGSGYPSEIIVVGTQPNTRVSLLFPGTRSGYRDTSFSLDSLDTYFYSAIKDLSGAQIKSNKPVAVISASEAARVPSFHPGYYGEAIAEFLPPDNFGGYKFIVPKLPGRDNYTVRVLATEPDTVAKFQNSSVTISYTLHMANTDEFVIGDEDLVITANKPVMVYQYAMSSDNDDDDNGAFMRNIPSIGNFVTEAKFDVQSVESTVQDIVQIIVPRGGTVNVDGKDIMSFPNLQRNDNDVDGQSYTVLKLILSPGYHIIEGGMVPFGALIHAYKGSDRAGYGSALGLRGPGCGTTIIPGPTTDSGQLCLSCDDVTHIYLCDVFEQCPPSQVCFVEQYKNFAHQLRYRMGCRNSSTCSRMTRDEPVVDLTTHIDKRVSLCVECCHGNFCNTQGCGGEALPPRSSRGPLCLSCGHVQNPAECNTLAFCQPEEVCYVEKTNLFGDVMHYSYGCETKQCRGSSHGKILCEQCCNDDFCNHACNSTGNPDILHIIDPDQTANEGDVWSESYCLPIGPVWPELTLSAMAKYNLLYMGM